MKKEEILKKTLNEEELQNVSGGNASNGSALGRGGCTENFYEEDCSASVEKGSHCGLSNDACGMWNHYTKA